MAHNEDLKLFLSNSQASADDQPGSDGLGGRISSDEPLFLKARPISGITFDYISGANKSGIGSLTFTFATSELTWSAPADGPGVGPAVVVAPGNSYTLESESSDAYIKITVNSLPTADKVFNVVIDANKNVIFDNVTLDESMSGLQDHRCVFLKNTGSTTLNNIYPIFKVPAPVSTVQSQTWYANSGSVLLKVNSATNWPASYFVRNTRTGEIMYYNARSGSDGKTLNIASTARGLRDSSSAEGLSGDTIELLSPLDISVSEYDTLTGTSTIIEDSIPPKDIVFFELLSSEAPNYSESFSLAAGEVLTIWLRRNIPEGASNIVRTPVQISFHYED